MWYGSQTRKGGCKAAAAGKLWQVMLCKRHRSRTDFCQADQGFRVRPARTAQLLREAGCTNTKLELIGPSSGGCLGWFRQFCFVEKKPSQTEARTVCGVGLSWSLSLG